MTNPIECTDLASYSADNDGSVATYPWSAELEAGLTDIAGAGPGDTTDGIAFSGIDPEGRIWRVELVYEHRPAFFATAKAVVYRNRKGEYWQIAGTGVEPGGCVKLDVFPIGAVPTSGAFAPEVPDEAYV